jgi:hypothetical protein
MEDRRYFVDIFGAIVGRVQELYDTVDQEKPYYLYGHYLDVLKVLTEKDQNDTFKYKKYPLIILIQDFQENHGENLSYGFTLPNIRVLITDLTDPDYHADQRYTNVFKPVLYPIYRYLLIAMDESFDIGTKDIDQIPHTKIDRVFWGTQTEFGSDASILDDYLDAIDLTFNNIEVFQTNNCIYT